MKHIKLFNEFISESNDKYGEEYTDDLYEESKIKRDLNIKKVKTREQMLYGKKIANKLMSLHSKIWNDLNIRSGTQLYSDKMLQTKYVEAMKIAIERADLADDIAKNGQEIYDKIENDNYHTLNAFLILGDYMLPVLKNTYIQMAYKYNTLQPFGVYFREAHDFFYSPGYRIKKGFNFANLSRGHEIINKKTGKTYVVQSVGADGADIKDKWLNKYLQITSLKDFEPVNPELYEGSEKQNKLDFADKTPLNEGQYSWMTQDTGRQIGSEKQNTITVYMFDDKGNKWKETSYDGYGEFGGKDYYELLAQMNGIENADRQDGIDIAFGKMKIKGDILFPALVENPNFNWKRHDFTEEAENDPNQSWYQEEDDSRYD